MYYYVWHKAYTYTSSVLLKEKSDLYYLYTDSFLSMQRDLILYCCTNFTLFYSLPPSLPSPPSLRFSGRLG